jgi:tRNA(Ile2) C34 agmatinyltransferase TiaS
MLAVKNQFRFASNKLAQVSKQLDIGEKIKTDFDLWSNVLAGDEIAQGKMEKYNRKDVQLLVDLYDLILPWIDKHPNVALYEDDFAPRCTRCGDTSLMKAGFRRTTAGKFQLYKCEGCGSTSRGYRRLNTTPLREG